MTKLPREPRPASRLLIIDPQRNVLLFRFDNGLTSPFWATPGGACDPGESYVEAARREMLEETGLTFDPGPEVAQRRVEFTTFDGINIWSDERYFMIRVPSQTLNTSGHTELEQRVMIGHRWWPLDALQATEETVFPADIAAMIEALVS